MLAALLLTSCQDEDIPSPSSTAVPWTSHAAVQVDTAFIMAPNLVTPNRDGINEVFHVISRHCTDLRTDVFRMNGSMAFGSDDLHPVWSGIDSTDLGRYRVHLQATSTSGQLLVAHSYLDIMDYSGADCLSFQGTPITGDQFDPRVFGVTYASIENFCP
ncbi:MAG: gliding motility-associated C-terminal domain-containing protein [Flavobacteriales bacterium]|nr:gliding motility-associated C-terminal domain-containing protein [Flavobacteriales bacterium]